MEWHWTRAKERAALLVAEDRETDERIAEACRVSRRTLTNWKIAPEFRERVAEHVAAFRAAIREQGIAILENRVAALQDRWKRMQRVIDERAQDPELAEVPGGTTGLVVHQVKAVGKGEDFQLIDLYQVDAGLLAELRAHEQQAAKELGQWSERVNQQVTGSLTVGTMNLDNCDEAELRERLARAAASLLPVGPDALREG